MQVADLKAYFDKHFPNGLPRVTERQHYVPVRYLTPWGTKHRIAMQVNRGKPKMVGIRDVAVRSWFYEFAELDFVELKTILDVINANAPDLYEREHLLYSLLQVLCRRLLAGLLLLKMMKKLGQC